MKKILSLILLLLSGGQMRAQENHNFETMRMLDIFNALYTNLDYFYVDTLNAETHIGNAIQYMLEQLDPYTEYYKENRKGELLTLTTGKYAGIGSPIRFHKANDRCVFVNPYEGMPAHKAGVRTGDVIMKIDGRELGVCGGKDVRTYSDTITKQLRGLPGTSLLLTVKRPGVNRLLNFRITREKIKQPSVLYQTVYPDGTAYLLLDGYTEDTAADMKAALEKMKARGAKRLIFDLRSNGGGLMGEAVKVVNFFVPRGKLVLETKAKDPARNSRVFTTEEALVDAEIPMAVLVDYGTASAAEITSGCLQDYDRAVVVGRRTYGKGVVQTPRELPYKNVLKLTTSKYYIPSGRCVQAYDYKHRGADGQPKHLPDSLCKTFYTAAGRPVKDGGGITPDVSVKLDSLPNLISYLQNSDVLFDYCVNYCNTHEKILPAALFQLTDEEFEHFKQYMVKSNFTYDNQTLRALQSVRQWAEFEGYTTTAKAELDALEAKLSHNLASDLELWKKEVKKVVEFEIVSNVYGQRGAVEYLHRNDRDYDEALRILNDPARYRQLLKL